jgi:hypothetical protein
VQSVDNREQRKRIKGEAREVETFGRFSQEKAIPGNRLKNLIYRK